MYKTCNEIECGKIEGVKLCNSSPSQFPQPKSVEEPDLSLPGVLDFLQALPVNDVCFVVIKNWSSSQIRGARGPAVLTSITCSLIDLMTHWTRLVVDMSKLIRAY